MAGAAASECPTASELHPHLAAVVADDPAALLHALRGPAACSKAGGTPCGLTACHLAAALGRRRCLVALLDAGIEPCVWTTPPNGTGPFQPGDEEDYASYDQVTKSEVYRLLKDLLPTQAAFPATFTLAQLLLKAPCCPLALAVRFGHGQSARTLLAAVRGSGSSDAQRQLEDALAWWPSGSELQVGLLRHLLAAGAHPIRALLPSLLRRYDGCLHSSGLADKLRSGMKGNPWGTDPEANCSLLVAAAAHDMPAVVLALLAVPPAVEGGQPPFSPNSWGNDGLSALMAAAHRGALGALDALLDCGATVNLADEMGATALHWAVVGGHKESVLALAQRGAAVDATGVVHEEEEHLERPLLTAAHRGDLDMMRLLIQLGASLDAPSPSGYTPLSVAICWEQGEAARLLLQLGADPNQLLEAHVNGGYYQIFSETSGAEEVRSLLTVALSRMDFRFFTTVLLEAGADPTLRHPTSGLTPAAEAASFGLVSEAALLFELTAAPAGPWSLDQLGWSEAMAEGLRNGCLHDQSECLHPLIEVWRAQPAPVPGAPPPAACRAIVDALLGNYSLKPQQSTGKLLPGAELAGVRAAEALATIGICADATTGLEDSPCKLVILAAAPAASRWSPARHLHFPPTFQRTVRALLLSSHRLAAKHAAAQAAADKASLVAARHSSPAGGEEPCPCVGCTISCPQERADYFRGVAVLARFQRDRLAETPSGLPTDALMEVVRCLAAEPVSTWLR
ncbi:ankyrin-3 isoform X9 isoform A [Chlorella sorokiniana]|uniref:Ankyrin-3 isoform X9 isoform A n=1 Tax=Chlorella sorokiniana TaxID=3076 RepID=A0A2P6TM44_CHLSO|nr:ankyrin-3 isoform X9 isoform A [Chlorella sorokiniana]|eukprot:PRW45403.1 ankyrin-3 isoform X9 isoform A [Chlorella sorokiniana]